MDRIRTLIVDDEKPARRRLAELLEPRAGHRGRRRGPRRARGGRPRAGAGAGPDVPRHPDARPRRLRRARRALEPEQQPVTVFVTAYDRYAIQAFEAHALDYLLKPFSDQRFEGALRRACQFLRSRDGQRAPSGVGLLLDERAGVRARTRASSSGSCSRRPAASRSSASRTSTGSRPRASTSTCTSARVRTSIARAWRTCCSASTRKRFVRVHRSVAVNTDAHPRAPAAQPRRLHRRAQERHRAGHEPRLPAAVRALAEAAALAGHRLHTSCRDQLVPLSASLSDSQQKAPRRQLPA